MLRSAGITQIYYVYNSSRIWSRSQYSTGAWTPWAREYNTLNKPSATDVGAYTKGESDNKFQPKGSYTPAGQAYTKAESDARYLQDIRLGAQVLVSGSGNGGKASLTAPSGHMLTAILDGDTSRWPMPDSPDQAYARPIQKKLVNGNWITVEQL
ncbi:pyocin knob domain-containing protein [Citrobacter werkmanii]|uniref:pyocin knob domain-containing protein n=1 Tax=Citrobacter werkmanii TaxID=67827 RepID=UPI003F5A8558